MGNGLPIVSGWRKTKVGLVFLSRWILIFIHKYAAKIGTVTVSTPASVPLVIRR